MELEYKLPYNQLTNADKIVATNLARDMFIAYRMLRTNSNTQDKIKSDLSDDFTKGSDNFCLKALLQYSVLWDFKSWFTFDANPFCFKLEQSSQLLRILLITTTLASLALGHSILATYFKV